MRDVSLITTACQLPLVFFISILLFKAANVLKINRLKYLSLAFILNFIYIFFTLISIVENTIKDINNPVLIIATFFELSTTLVILIGFIPIKCKSKTKRRYYFAINWILYSTVLYISFATSNALLRNITIASYCAVGYIGGILFFNFASGVYSAKKYVNVGFIIWSVLQIIVCVPEEFLSAERANAYGFGISMLAKTLILFGIFQLYVEYTVDSVRNYERLREEQRTLKKSSENLNNILRTFFHEMLIPFRSLESSLESLFKVVPREVARIHQATIEGNYERIRTIINISRNLYHKESIFLLDDDDVFFDGDSKDIFSINNLIEISIRSLTNVYKDFEPEVRYGKNCFVLCDKNEMIQAIVNLLKNAIEVDSIEPKKISIKSYLQRNFEDDVLQKSVIVDIEDNGAGISESNKEVIWNPGFTTKKVDHINQVRGQGLYVVKTIIENNNGKIEVYSPIRKTNKNEFGTLFRLILSSHSKNKT